MADYQEEPAKPLAPLAEALDEIEDAIGMLDNNLDRLLAKLRPVMSNVELPIAEDSSPHNPADESQSEVVLSLKGKAQWIRRISDSINYTILRLDT